MRALRRLLLLVAIAAVALAVVRRRRPLPIGDAPTWPALDVTVREVAAPAAGIAAPATASWVEPVDGECPSGYPVKANASSRIFHVPGGRSYARTKPERCYATPEDAEADGFRRAKL